MDALCLRRIQETLMKMVGGLHPELPEVKPAHKLPENAIN
jgi:hypothetical protein